MPPFDYNFKRRLLYKIGFIMEAKAKEMVPVDTGLLRSSIHVSKVDTRMMRVTVSTSTPIDYGIFMEKGARPHTPPFKPIEKWAKRHGIPAWAVFMSIKKKGIRVGTGKYPLKTLSGYRPFMESAFYQSLPAIKQTIKNEIENEIKRYNG